MARHASLEPYFDNSSARWVVSVPRKLSSTGKRKREYFIRKVDAEHRADGLKALQKASVSAVHRAGPDLIKLAVNYDELFREIYGLEGGLAEACECYMRQLDAQQKAATFGALLEGFEKDHQRDWSRESKTRWNWFRKHVHPLFERKAAELNPQFFVDWLGEKAEEEDWSDQTFNDVAGLLSGIWRRGVNHGLVTGNPMEGVKRRKIRKRAVPVYEVDQVQSLMECAWRHDPDLVPYFAIAIFGGLRPGDKDSEIMSLQWEDVNFEQKWIRVGANFDNKTGTKRFVPMEDNLALWLESWKASKGDVIPQNFRRRRRYLTRGKYQSPPGTPEKDWTELVPFGSEVRDITRHTYGSYLDAKYRDRNMVMANMGHTNFKTYEQHYKNARSPQEAEAFWNIVPPTSVQDRPSASS